jgi:hypothetical protein
MRFTPVRCTPVRCTPCEMYAREMHAYKIQAHEAHAREIYAHRSMFWGYGGAGCKSAPEPMCLRSPATMTSTRFTDNEHPKCQVHEYASHE